MTATYRKRDTMTQGHVALYSRDAIWRRTVAESLREAGHSFGQAAQPDEVQRLLEAQRYDVLALQVHDEAEGDAIASALQGTRLPLHTILVGNASALPLRQERRLGSTFRYVPGELTAGELSRLVDVSIISGSWDEPGGKNGAALTRQQVDLQEAIDRAASAVLGRAHRKKQTFRSAVIGASGAAYADEQALVQSLTMLLRLAISAAPQRASVSVDAEAHSDEWVVRIAGAAEEGDAATARQAVQMLSDESEKLDGVSKRLREQGGMLWVELQSSGLPAFAFTVPMSSAGEMEPAE